jgi:hypothetical protein
MAFHLNFLLMVKYYIPILSYRKRLKSRLSELAGIALYELGTAQPQLVIFIYSLLGEITRG